MTISDDRVEDAAVAAEDAHQQVVLQRAKLATMSQTDPDRVREEEKLRDLTEAASLADAALTECMDDEEAGNAKPS